jgi:hypothetical protein
MLYKFVWGVIRSRYYHTAWLCDVQIRYDIQFKHAEIYRLERSKDLRKNAKLIVLWHDGL